jgi:hypothetical protein
LFQNIPFQAGDGERSLLHAAAKYGQVGGVRYAAALVKTNRIYREKGLVRRKRDIERISE